MHYSKMLWGSRISFWAGFGINLGGVGNYIVNSPTVGATCLAVGVALYVISGIFAICGDMYQREEEKIMKALTSR